VGTEPQLRTRRLLLRRWRNEDRTPFAALNADPAVMEHFPATLRHDESDALVDRIEAGFEQRGWGLWAVEAPGSAPFVGFVGLNPATFDAPFTPAVEIGWRLAREHWGKGYATEGALAALAFGFDTLSLDEIVSFTTTANTRSRQVMERLDMQHDAADDFENPNVPVGDPSRPHVLYRLARNAWQRNAARAAR
jgi:RimJ/RimL family protein N-acetyltransferase